MHNPNGVRGGKQAVGWRLVHVACVFAIRWLCRYNPAARARNPESLMTAPPVDLSDLDLHCLPYPVALTARRLADALDEPGHDPLKALFLLKDAFEAAVKFLGAVLLVEFGRQPVATAARKEELLNRLVRPSLGVWVNQVAGNLSHWLADCPAAPAATVAGLFARRGPKKPQPTPLLERCREFVTFRNDALGHGASRSDAAYRADLRAWLPDLRRLLDGVAALADWPLWLVTNVDRGQAWMGPQPPGATAPGAFRREHVGHFVLRGPGPDAALDLYPFLCYLPDPDRHPRLHYYDAVYRYQATKKQADVLEYDRGYRYPRDEPIAGLEAAFTADLLAKAFQWQRGRLAVIEGRVANFGEILEAHAAIVGRRWAVERVRQFLREQDRGLLVIEAEPGKGKTALLAHLIENEFGGHAPRPVHFFYRRTAGITEPDVCVKSLYHALLAAHDLTEAEESQRQTAPHEVRAKLVNLLCREIAPRLAPGRPQLLFVDALDEADGNAFQALPENLPEGVYVIASTRPVVGRTTLARRAHLHWLSLDDPDWGAADHADGFEYVQRELAATRLPAATLEAIARVGAGNFLVLKLLCQHVRVTLPPEQVAEFLRRLATDGGHDRLGFIYAEFWERLTQRCTADDVNRLCDAAGLLVTAHAPLTREIVCGALHWRAGDWDFACRRLAEYLTAREYEEDGVQATYYRIYHESFADFLRAKVATDRERYSRYLANYCRNWQDLPAGYERTYALRFGPRHLLETQQADEAASLLLDWRFLEAKAEAGLVFDLAGDCAAVAGSLPPDDAHRRTLGLVEEALRRDLHFLGRHPGCLFQCLWNTAWWYDCPQAAAHYDLTKRMGQGPLPWEQEGPKLSGWLQQWREQKERAQPGFVWLRALRPPAVHLRTALKAILRGHEGNVNSVYSVAWSADATQLASAGHDRTVRVWDAQTGAELLCLRGHESYVLSVAWSAGGTRLASAGTDGTVRVWDTRRGAELLCLRGHQEAVHSVAWSADGTRLASAGGKAVRVWDARRGAELLCLRRHEDAVYSVAWSAYGARLASAGGDGTVRIWDARRGAELLCLSGHEGPVVKSVAWSADSTKLASTAYDQTVRVWDARNGAELLCFRGHQDVVLSVAWSADGAQLASAGEDGTVRIWDARSEAELIRLRGHEHLVLSVAWSPDGARLASAAEDSTARVWDARSGAELLCLQGHKDRVEQVAWSHDGARLASAAYDQTVRVWDARRGAELLCLRGHAAGVLSVAWSADGARLASAGYDRTVRVWDARSGAELLRLRGHEREITCLAWSADGARLASAGCDQTVRGWDAHGGAELLCLRGHEDRVTRVAWSANGARLASAAWDGTVRVWDARGGACLEVIRESWDLRPFATPGNTSPWHAQERGLETAVVSAAQGQAIAWLPERVPELIPDPAGRTWASSVSEYLCLFTLEGSPDCPAC
jgi:WD40 repeat protein